MLPLSLFSYLSTKYSPKVNQEPPLSELQGKQSQFWINFELLTVEMLWAQNPAPSPMINIRVVLTNKIYFNNCSYNEQFQF